VPAALAVDKLSTILAASGNFLKAMHERGAQPHQRKVYQRLFSPSEAADMVGRDRTTLARAEVEIGVADAMRNPSNGRRLGYTLQQVNAFRAHFGTLPWRVGSDEPIVLGCQNFKGGVGKSTTCVNFAHYLALKGYRVLVVDADSQATTTAMFGYLPDQDIEPNDTLLPYLLAEATSLDPVVRQTYVPGVDLIPACLGLYDAELSMVGRIVDQPTQEQRAAVFQELRYGLATVAERYDAILVDSPPSLGMVSINVLMAADALLVPCPAKMFDFASTVQFFEMIQNYIGRLDPDKRYRWIKVMTTLFMRGHASQKQFFEVMQACFGDSLLQHVFFHTAGLANASAEYLSPYEQQRVDRALLGILDAVFGELELAFLREWPSKANALAARGVPGAEVS
jgi:chromosome partitioning protein